MKPAVHPIEARSYEIMESEVDFSRWPPGARELVMRMVHATADESFAQTALVGEAAVGALVAALRSRVAVVCDANMVAAGVAAVAASCPVVCYLDGSIKTTSGGTRSAAAVERAAQDHPDDAVWVFGNAPTAVVRLLEMHAAGLVSPSAVIALPVGYVGAAESKQSLWDSSLRSIAITNRGRRGGSAAAAAVINAAWRLASGDGFQ